MFLSKCKRGACDSATSFSKLGGESPCLGPCIRRGKENMPLGMSARLVKCNFFATGLGVMFWEYTKKKLYVFEPGRIRYLGVLAC